MGGGGKGYREKQIDFVGFHESGTYLPSLATHRESFLVTPQRGHITADDGKTYHLPTAEYDKTGEFTRQQVLDSARAAAAETGKSFAVLVTESDGRTWVGLKELAKSQYVYSR
jgi:photosystem II stability/assembly factor-like uncharacterized protein